MLRTFEKLKIRFVAKMNFQNCQILPMISKFSLVEASLTFSTESLALSYTTKKTYSSKDWKSFFLTFLYWEYQTHDQYPDFIKFLPAMHFHPIEKHPVQISSKSKLSVDDFYTFSRQEKKIINWKYFDNSIWTKTVRCLHAKSPCNKLIRVISWPACWA